MPGAGWGLQSARSITMSGRDPTSRADSGRAESRSRVAEGADGTAGAAAEATPLPRREAMVLLIMAAGVAMSLYGTRSMLLTASWAVPLNAAASYVDPTSPAPHERLPLPVVTDLDADGRPEVVVATRSPPGIRVYDGAAVGAVGVGGDAISADDERDGLPQPALLSEARLVSSVRVAHGRRPVALAVGWDGTESIIASAATDGARRSGARFHERRRRNVVVVVTQDWGVLCFDYVQDAGGAGRRLQLRWETAVTHMDGVFSPDVVSGSEGAMLYHREVAVSIVPSFVDDSEPQQSRDSARAPATVLVAGSMDRIDAAVVAGASETTMRGGLGFLHGDDGDAGDVASGAGAGDADAVLPEVDQLDPRSIDHFSVFALSADNGRTKWRHEVDGIDEEQHGDDVQIAVHDYDLSKLRAAARGAPGPSARGRRSWRAFRESVLAALPHSWTRRSDTKVEAARFERRRAGNGREAWARTDADADNNAHLGFEIPGADSFKDAVVGDKGDRQLDGPTRAGGRPNVILARGRRGLEALHLRTGHPVMYMGLPVSGTFADIDGDSVVDHIEAVGTYRGVARFGEGSRGGIEEQLQLPGCFARATSGMPPEELLFNASLCTKRSSWMPVSARNSAAKKKRSSGSLGGSDVDNVEVLKPVVVRAAPRPEERGTGKRGVDAMVSVFHTSTGLITALDHSGSQLWQVDTVAGWQPHLDPMHRGFEPSTTPFVLSPEDDPFDWEHVLLFAAGQAAATVVKAKTGAVSSTLRYTVPPVDNPVVGDFTGDGVSDVILVSADRITGYSSTRTTGSTLMMTLMCVVVVCILVVAGVRQLDAAYATEEAGYPAPRRGTAGSSERKVASPGGATDVVNPWYENRARVGDSEIRRRPAR